MDLAGHCADVFVDENAADAIADVRAICSKHYHISEADCDAMLDDIGRRTKEVAPLFEINIASGDQLRGDPQEGQRSAGGPDAPHAAAGRDAFRSRTRHLKQAGDHRRLTGLANRAHFDEFLSEHSGVRRPAASPCRC